MDDIEITDECCLRPGDFSHPVTIRVHPGGAEFRGSEAKLSRTEAHQLVRHLTKLLARPAGERK